jgi:hypothetical protein
MEQGKWGGEELSPPGRRENIVSIQNKTKKSKRKFVLLLTFNVISRRVGLAKQAYT